MKLCNFVHKIYNIDTQTKLTAVFEKAGNEYIGYIEEIPGVNIHGYSVYEVRENLIDALKLTLEVRRETILTIL